MQTFVREFSSFPLLKRLKPNLYSVGLSAFGGWRPSVARVLNNVHCRAALFRLGAPSAAAGQRGKDEWTTTTRTHVRRAAIIILGVDEITPRRALTRGNTDHARTDVPALATFTVAQRAVKVPAESAGAVAR